MATGWLWRLLGRSPLKTGAGVISADPPAHAGKVVTVDSALQLSTFFACARVTGQTVGSLPLKVYRKTKSGGREEASDHPLHGLLGVSPNAEATPLEFVEGMVAAALISGNGYAEKGIASGNRPVALTQITEFCTPKRNSDGALVYEVMDRGKREVLPQEKVFHLRAFGIGGDEGLSALRHGVQTFSSSWATEEAAAKVFANGMHLSGVFNTPGTLSDEQRALAQTMINTFAGSSRAGKALLLEGGFTYSPVSMNPEEAQMLASRAFNVEEICRWFGVPPVIIGHAGQGQTMWGSGVEQIMLAWLTLGLNPLMRRFEARILKDLVPVSERGTIYAEFNRDGLLQADSAARAEFFSKMVSNGVLTRNEVRALLNRPASADPVADQLTAQVNLAPLARLAAPSIKMEA